MWIRVMENLVNRMLSNSRESYSSKTEYDIHYVSYLYIDNDVIWFEGLYCLLDDYLFSSVRIDYNNT